MHIRTKFNYDRRAASIATAHTSKGPSRTQQHMKDETDINVMMRRFQKTGVMPQGIRVPTYGDFDHIIDFQTAQNVLIEGQKSFMKLPSAVRARFHNDPQAFLEFTSKEENLEEMRTMGLVNPLPKEENKPVVAPIPAPV